MAGQEAADPKYHLLLTGIDNDPGHELEGCVNDTRRGLADDDEPVAVTTAERGFRPDKSAGLFIGVSSFFTPYGEPSTEIHGIDFAADDAVDLAELFSLQLKLIDPKCVRLALAGAPRKQRSRDALQKLLGLGARQFEARFVIVLDLLEEVRRLAGGDGLLVTSFATHGYSVAGRDHLLCQDSLLSQPHVTSVCVQDFLGKMQEEASTSARRRLVLIDACREFLKKSRGLQTEPLSDSFSRAVAETRGTAVLTSTVAGGFSYDDPEVQNGVFSASVRAGLLGEAPPDERGFITPETLAVFLHQRVAGWVAKNRKGDRDQSTGIAKVLDEACARMPLAVNAAKWRKWQREEELRSRLTASQIASGLAALEQELTVRAPVLLDRVRALRDRLAASPEDADALAGVDAIAKEILKIPFAHFARSEPPAPYKTRDAFPGGRPFRENEQEFFFGRDTEVKELVELIVDHPIVLVTGRPACGKTSLVEAGVVPALRKRFGQLRYRRVTPLLELQAIEDATDEDATDEDAVDEDAEAVAAIEDARRGATDGALLLFIDPEVDVHGLRLPADVLDRLESIATTAGARVYIVLALRDDAAAEYQEMVGARPGLRAEPYHVDALEGGKLEDALRSQVMAAHARLDPPALARRMVREVQDQRCRMALAQITIDRLHELRHGDLLVESEYEKLGGIEGVLADTAEKLYDAANHEKRELIQDIFTSLLVIHDTDRASDRVAPIDLFWRDSWLDLLAQMEPLRLIFIEQGKIQLTHERIMEAWPRLRAWRTDPTERGFLLLRQRLVAARVDYEAQQYRGDAIRLRGELLDEYARLVDHPRIGFSESFFLTECFARRERERRNVADQRVKDLSGMGWGVVFPAAAPGSEAAERHERVRQALEPLFALRRKQTVVAQTKQALFREFEGDAGYLHGESAGDFLARHGAAQTSIQPQRMPYYLLLVGDPEEIPLDFQYQLDLHHAVGRIHFDTVEEYAEWAAAVVVGETCYSRSDRGCTVFGVSQEPSTRGDLAVRVVRELAAQLDAEHLGWKFDAVSGAVATRARLLDQFPTAPREPDSYGRWAKRLGPELLVTVTDAVCHEPGDPRQASEQGALLCHGGESFSATDVPVEPWLHGTVALLWSPFSVATPRLEDALVPGAPRRELAPRNLLSPLPQALLRGGAGAVIGIVERNHLTSYVGANDALQIEPIVNAIVRLIDGYPVGAAMEFFNRRHALLAAELQFAIDRGDDAARLRQLRTALAAARHFVLAGDPACRLNGTERD